MWRHSSYLTTHRSGVLLDNNISNGEMDYQVTSNKVQHFMIARIEWVVAVVGTFVDFVKANQMKCGRIIETRMSNSRNSNPRVIPQCLLMTSIFFNSEQFYCVKLVMPNISANRLLMVNSSGNPLSTKFYSEYNMVLNLLLSDINLSNWLKIDKPTFDWHFYVQFRTRKFYFSIWLKFFPSSPIDRSNNNQVNWRIHGYGLRETHGW